MNRLEELRKIIDAALLTQPDVEERRCGFVHLYGVSATCTFIAQKRKLNEELCAAAGMLHDISSYVTGSYLEHSRHSSVEARRILEELGCFSPGEVNIICSAIYSHSDKHRIDDEYDEALKDADVLQHYLYSPQLFVKEDWMDRLSKLKEEML